VVSLVYLGEINSLEFSRRIRLQCFTCLINTSGPQKGAVSVLTPYNSA
jgi:hypothetical protein